MQTLQTCCKNSKTKAGISQKGHTQIQIFGYMLSMTARCVQSTYPNVWICGCLGFGFVGIFWIFPDVTQCVPETDHISGRHNYHRTYIITYYSSAFAPMVSPFLHLLHTLPPCHSQTPNPPPGTSPFLRQLVELLWSPDVLCQHL